MNSSSAWLCELLQCSHKLKKKSLFKNISNFQKTCEKNVRWIPNQWLIKKTKIFYISFCSRTPIISVLPCLHVKCPLNLKLHRNIYVWICRSFFKNFFSILYIKFCTTKTKSYTGILVFGKGVISGFQAYLFSMVLYWYSSNHLTNYQLHCHFPIVQIKIASFCTFTAFGVVHEFPNARITNLWS